MKSRVWGRLGHVWGRGVGSCRVMFEGEWVGHEKSFSMEGGWAMKSHVWWRVGVPWRVMLEGELVDISSRFSRRLDGRAMKSHVWGRVGGYKKSFFMEGGWAMKSHVWGRVGGPRIGLFEEGWMGHSSANLNHLNFIDYSQNTNQKITAPTELFVYRSLVKCYSISKLQIEMYLILFTLS